jgi:hypothetical protein
MKVCPRQNSGIFFVRCFVYIPKADETPAAVFETLRQTPEIRLHPTIIIGSSSDIQ